MLDKVDGNLKYREKESLDKQKKDCTEESLRRIFMTLIPVTFDKIIQSRSYTIIVLSTESKKFAIYTDPLVGQTIQIYVTENTNPRPYTHDLIKSIFQGFEIKVLQIVINEIEDTTYFARIFLEQKSESKTQIIEIDARPSDCITLSLMHNTPIFCKKEIIEKAIPVEI